jgi:hypothetical protein
MKKHTLILLVLGLSISTFLHAKSGLTISFKTGVPTHGTQIGLKIGPLAVLAGVDSIRLTGNFEENVTYYERDEIYNSQTGGWEWTDLYKYKEYSSEMQGQGLLTIPNISGKFYAIQSSLNAYLFGSAQMVIPSVDGWEKSSTTYYDADGSITDRSSSETYLSDSDKEQIHDVLDSIGLTLGFGIEYPLDKHFSIGGEYSLTYYSNQYAHEDQDTDDYDTITSWKKEWEEKARGDLGITGTRFTLNYYF